MGRSVAEIDKLLTAICPPDEIKRTPRSIQTTLKYWRGKWLKSACRFLHAYICIMMALKSDSYVS